MTAYATFVEYCDIMQHLLHNYRFTNAISEASQVNESPKYQIISLTYAYYFAYICACMLVRM